MSLEQTLESLKDIEGVHGSFLFTRTGALIACDLPSVFGTDVLSEAALRTARLWEALNEVDRTIDSCVLRYQEHKLYLRPVVQGVLCVLTPPTVNMPALRMAVNLVVKRLNRLLVDVDFAALGTNSGPAPQANLSPTPPSVRGGLPNSAPVGRPAPSPAVPAPVPSGPPRQSMVYRGRRYDV